MKISITPLSDPIWINEKHITSVEAIFEEIVYPSCISKITLKNSIRAFCFTINTVDNSYDIERETFEEITNLRNSIIRKLEGMLTVSEFQDITGLGPAYTNRIIKEEEMYFENGLLLKEEAMDVVKKLAAGGMNNAKV